MADQSTNFTASNGEYRNPFYQGTFEDETTEQMEHRLHWAAAAVEAERAVQNNKTAPQPVVQGEPVGWQFYQDGKWWHGDDRIKDHRKNTEAAGYLVRDVYAAPQPAEPDEERLAMEAVMESVDLATWPGLTTAQRCALGRFAKPQPAEQQPVPDAQGEPVACEVVGRAYHESFGSGVRLKLYIDAHQWPITEPIPIGTKLYFRPHPTEQQPDVTALVEALEQVIRAAPSSGPLWHGSEQIVEARNALAAHCIHGAKPKDVSDE